MTIAEFENRTIAQKARDVLGADVVLDSFLRHGVEHVFIFPGGTIAPILDRIEKRSRIEIVCPRTEQARLPLRRAGLPRIAAGRGYVVQW